MDHDVGAAGSASSMIAMSSFGRFGSKPFELGMAVNRLHRDALGSIAAGIEHELHVGGIASGDVRGGQHMPSRDQDSGVADCP